MLKVKPPDEYPPEEGRYLRGNDYSPCAVESPGHLCGEALIALLEQGVDEQKKIIGTEALTPFLYNLPIESIGRFRKQVKLINLLNEGNPEDIHEQERRIKEIMERRTPRVRKNPGREGRERRSVERWWIRKR
jgi:tetrahydromethanopterin S-methyltransferase subunit A